MIEPMVGMKFRTKIVAARKKACSTPTASEDQVAEAGGQRADQRHDPEVGLDAPPTRASIARARSRRSGSRTSAASFTLEELLVDEQEADVDRDDAEVADEADHAGHHGAHHRLEPEAVEQAVDQRLGVEPTTVASRATVGSSACCSPAARGPRLAMVATVLCTTSNAEHQDDGRREQQRHPPGQPRADAPAAGAGRSPSRSARTRPPAPRPPARSPAPRSGAPPR